MLIGDLISSVSSVFFVGTISLYAVELDFVSVLPRILLHLSYFTWYTKVCYKAPI